MAKGTILSADGSPLSFVDDDKVIRNNLSPMFGSNPFIVPGGVGDPFTPKIDTIDTLAKNLRNYLFSNFRQVLAQAYVEIGLFGIIVDVPVDDALRGGVEVHSEELEEAEINDLLAFMEEVGDFEVAGEGMKWARLFGGGAIIPIVEDQDPEEPLDLESIDENTEIELRAVDLWELYSGMLNTSGQADDPDPMKIVENSEFYMYYSQKIHKSRVLKIKGRRAPSWIRPRLRGWGLSVVENVVRSMNQYLKNANVTFELIDEAKLDIFMLEGLAATLQTDEGFALAQRRVQMANARKNYLTATVLDGKDKFEQRTLTFAGMADVQAGARMQVAADLRMPLTKIFGVSAAGFNSGEDDIEVYNGMIESQIRPQVRPHIIKIVKIRCMQLFGFIPDDLTVKFHSLRMLSGVDEQTVKSSKHTALLAARSANEISRFEYREAVNKGKLLDISLSNEADKLNPDDPMIDGILADDGKEPEVVPGKPGAPKAPAAGGGKKQENAPKEAPKKPVKNSMDPEVEFLGFAGPRIVTVGIICKGEILCGRRRDNGLWTSPGGHIDQGETPEQGAVREVKEEAGIDLDPGDLRKISVEKIVSHRTGKEFMICCYLANVDEKPVYVGGADPDHEVEEWKWVQISEDSPELAPSARHAKKDSVLAYLFGMKNAGISNPGKVDESLWKKAKDVSMKALGKIKWPFVTYIYKKHGGTFE